MGSQDYTAYACLQAKHASGMNMPCVNIVTQFLHHLSSSQGGRGGPCRWVLYACHGLSCTPRSVPAEARSSSLLHRLDCCGCAGGLLQPLPSATLLSCKLSLLKLFLLTVLAASPAAVDAVMLVALHALCLLSANAGDVMASNTLTS